MGNIETTTIIAGNWKMYKTIDEATTFVEKLIPEVKESSAKVCLAVPYTLIKPTADLAKEANVIIGAQNMNDASEGAFTGEIAARMLKDAGARFVIIGHSERRQLFGENNEFINKKVQRALKDDLQPFLCIGETLKEREEGKTEEVLHQQLTECLKQISIADLKKVVIAYEPVWAIGTGETATPEQAQEAHHSIRTFIGKHWDDATAKGISLLYGGSVKPENIKNLMDQDDINGVLVGGASLSLESFVKIVNYNKS